MDFSLCVSLTTKAEDYRELASCAEGGSEPGGMQKNSFVNLQDLFYGVFKFVPHGALGPFALEICWRPQDQEGVKRPQMMAAPLRHRPSLIIATKLCVLHPKFLWVGNPDSKERRKAYLLFKIKRAKKMPQLLLKGNLFCLFDIELQIS